jgi:hypothetical protein
MNQIGVITVLTFCQAQMSPLFPTPKLNRLVIVDGTTDQVICDDGRATFSA